MTRLCFPMATMPFFAGVVSDESSSIQSNVILQIEPHGRIRIAGQSINTDVSVRLITYAPFMQFNERPPQCGESKCAPTYAIDLHAMYRCCGPHAAVTLMILFHSPGSSLLLPDWKGWK